MGAFQKLPHPPETADFVPLLRRWHHANSKLDHDGIPARSRHNSCRDEICQRPPPPKSPSVAISERRQQTIERKGRLRLPLVPVVGVDRDVSTSLRQ
jgi:hypothetical protein